MSNTSAGYPNWVKSYKVNSDSNEAGLDNVLGSHLLGEQHFANQTALAKALAGFCAAAEGSWGVRRICLVGGESVVRCRGVGRMQYCQP
jgi:hypothetical protein